MGVGEDPSEGAADGPGLEARVILFLWVVVMAMKMAFYWALEIIRE